jgi:RHS repeat-associated protein
MLPAKSGKPGETGASGHGQPPQSDCGTRKAPITWIFEPGTFSPAAKLVGTASYSILCDHLGTPVSMSDGKGKEVWTAKIDLMGGLDAAKGDRSACPFRFPGQYEDGETGLYYNRHRYYDSEVGRYISKDPIGLAGGLRPYAYVSDPNTWVDYFGLAFERPYTQEETSQILDESEGRPSPTNPTKEGHARGAHVGQSNKQLTDRVNDPSEPNQASTFESAQAQDRATAQALNSPEGQAKLAELDADPTKKRVVINATDTGPETMRNAKKNRGYIVKQNSRTTTVVVDVLDRAPGAERIHIQTCVPKA